MLPIVSSIQPLRSDDNEPLMSTLSRFVFRLKSVAAGGLVIVACAPPPGDDPSGQVASGQVPSYPRAPGTERVAERLEALARGGTDGPDPDITFLLGRSLAGANNSDAALEKFRETVKREPRFHEAFFEAAKVLRRRGDSEAAVELLNRACQLAPDEIRYNRELVELVLSDGYVGDDEEVGLAACDRLMVNDEENAWQYLKWIAELYIRRGFIREARDPLQKALNLVPRDRATDRMEIERCLASLTTDQ